MPENEEDAAQANEPVLPGIIVAAEGSTPSTNKRADALTIYVDAVQGATLSPFTVKISFMEQFVVEGDYLMGRYVLNLVMPTPQLRAMGDLFIRLAQDLDQVAAGVAPDGQ